MRSLFKQAVIVGLLSFIFIAHAQAAWKCRVQNAKGQVWYGTASGRAGAVANAMRFCARNSTYARNCVLNSCWRI